MKKVWVIEYRSGGWDTHNEIVGFGETRKEAEKYIQGFNKETKDRLHIFPVDKNKKDHWFLQ